MQKYTREDLMNQLGVSPLASPYEVGLLAGKRKMPRMVELYPGLMLCRDEFFCGYNESLKHAAVAEGDIPGNGARRLSAEDVAEPRTLEPTVARQRNRAKKKH